MLAVTQKRLMGELAILRKNREPYYQVIQDDTNIFKFYFLIRGDENSDYKNGYYIGTIDVPADYPNKPGDFTMLTPSGRFAIKNKICLTNTGYHSDEWRMAGWNIQTMVIGFVSIFYDDEAHGISHIKDSPAQRRKYAEESVEYNKAFHYEIFKKFDYFVNDDCSVKSESEVLKLIEDSKPKKKTKQVSSTPTHDDSVKVETNDILLQTNQQPAVTNNIPTTRAELLDHILSSTVETFNYDILTMVLE